MPSDFSLNLFCSPPLPLLYGMLACVRCVHTPVHGICLEGSFSEIEYLMHK